MALNKIKTEASWGESAGALNSNFESIETDLIKVKNATTRNKGYFSSSSALESAFPTANVGDIAYVGSAYPYAVWKWNGSVWVNSGSTGGEESVNLGNYYTKEETNEKFTETAEEVSTKAGAKDLRKHVNKYNSFIQVTSEDGLLFTDEEGNVFIKYDKNGFDVGKVSKHLKNSITKESVKNYQTSEDGLFFTDEEGNVFIRYDKSGFDVGRVSKRLKSSITKESAKNYQTSEDGLFFTDEEGNVFIKYDKNGFDVGKVSKRLINKINGENKSMKEWNDLGLGLFIHWGVYSVLGGIYKGVNSDGEDIEYSTDSISEWILKNARIPRDVYMSFQKDFTASKWDSDFIAKTAYKCGFKYIVITAKHHEGFVLFDSKYADWNITTSQSRSTILDELKASCDKYGLKFCIYISQCADWTSEGGFGQEFYKNDGVDPYSEQQHQEYISTTINLINEVVDRYNPYVIWYDAPSVSYEKYAFQLFENQIETYPTIIVNDRLLPDRTGGDFATGEGGYYKGERTYAENCFTTNGSWGYCINNDNDLKQDADYIVVEKYIIESRSRGHNALINISPKADGSISSLTTDCLNGVYQFVNRYGLVSGFLGITKGCFPNWGRILKKGNTLKCFVFDKSTEIIVEGVDMSFINSVRVYDIENEYSLHNYNIVNEETVKISNIPSRENEGFPSVVDIEFGNTIVSEVYSNILSDEKPTLNALAFNAEGDGYLIGYGTSEYEFGGWTSGGNISTTCKYQRDTRDYYIKINRTLVEKDGITYNILVKDLTENSEKTINVLDNGEESISENSITMYKGHIYTIKIGKTGGWVNFKSLSFV